MKKYYIFLFIFFTIYCNHKITRVEKAKNLSKTILSCDTTGFDLSDYFNINKITRFDYEIEHFKEIDNKKMPADSGILFVGSSSIRKWSDLEQMFADLPIIKRGFGGSTFPELIYYADDIIFKYTPSIILVYEGDNDQYFLRPFQIFECACYLEKIIHQKLS